MQQSRRGGLSPRGTEAAGNVAILSRIQTALDLDCGDCGKKGEDAFWCLR
jgi:hypothetical protein